MEIIFELLFELVFQFLVQFLGEVLLDAGFEGLANALSNRTSRIVIGVLVAIGGGLAFGWWWGNRYADRFGTSDIPTALLVSACLAIAFAVLTGISAIREYRSPDPPPGPVALPLRSLDRWLPWRWPPGRLAGFALLNGAVAVGITVGFTPEDVRLR
jgi:hypothetical protein